MKKLIVFLLVGFLGNLAWAGEQKKDVTERLQMATDVLGQMTSAPDKGIPEEVLDSAKCIAVVPHLVKGGFIFGGKHGAAWPPAGQPMAGAHRLLYQWAEGARACRLAWKAWT